MKKNIFYLITLSVIFCGGCKGDSENKNQKEASMKEKEVETCKLVGQWQGNDGFTEFVYFYNEDGSFVQKMIINENESIDYIGTYEYDDEKSEIHLKWTDCSTNSQDAEYIEIAKQRKQDFINPLRYTETIEWIDEDSFVPELNGIKLLTRVK